MNKRVYKCNGCTNSGCSITVEGQQDGVVDKYPAKWCPISAGFPSAVEAEWEKVKTTTGEKDD
jgi:hypothetical protein